MNNSKQFFITGIGTGVGKTVVAATLVQHFQCAYWKPVQAGDLHQTDTMTVGSLVDTQLQLYPERYRLKTAASPHQAAATEEIMIRPEDFVLPPTRGGLIVEGAGGLFVPLNGDYFMIDLVQQLDLPVVLVARDYLGCINHTLLSLAALQYRQIPIAYLVFNGAFNPASRQVIERHIPTGTAVLELPEISRLDREEIRQVSITLTEMYKQQQNGS